MLLTSQAVALFFRLHRTLMFFVNQRLRVIPEHLANPEAFAALSPETRLKVRDAFLNHADLLQSFVDENSAHLPDDELEIARSWQHPEWTLPGRMEDNPLVWMLEVNGLMLDIRRAPRELQEIAFRKGLIPYIPADRQQGE
jgi:hypothetical protein